MAPQSTRILRPEDLDDVGRTSGLAVTDRYALRAVSEWIKDFVARPHKDLGRDGTVCPFIPGSLKRRTLFLLPTRSPIGTYRRSSSSWTTTSASSSPRHLRMATTRSTKTIIVVFTDLPAERAADLFNEVLGQLAGPSYEEDRIIFGPFYEGNDGTAIYNPSFRPFQSPVPFLFVRHTVLSDWKFFVDDPDWLDRWARSFGPSATGALAEELRRLPGA